MLLVASIVIVTINFSRMYLLATAASLLVLCVANKPRIWLKESLITIALLILTFMSLHLIASKGTSFGTALFGNRATSLVQPDTEESSATRMSLLRPIKEKIREYPILGSGLGATIPLPGTDKKTTQFDWGYLELWAELGLIGLGTWVICAMYFIYYLVRRHSYTGYAAALTSLTIMNITIPVFFHLFGIIILVLIAAVSFLRHSAASEV